jgi:hypothetical protein
VGGMTWTISSILQRQHRSALHSPGPYASGEPVREDLYGSRRVDRQGDGRTVVAVTHPGHPRRYLSAVCQGVAVMTFLTRMGVKGVLEKERGKMWTPVG